MGRLLLQASILGVYEKLTMAETLAAIGPLPASSTPATQEKPFLYASVSKLNIAFLKAFFFEFCRFAGFSP